MRARRILAAMSQRGRLSESHSETHSETPSPAFHTLASRQAGSPPAALACTRPHLYSACSAWVASRPSSPVAFISGTSTLMLALSSAGCCADSSGRRKREQLVRTSAATDAL